MNPNEIIVQTLSIFIVVTLISICFKKLLQVWVDSNVLTKNHKNRNLRVIKYLFDKLPLLLINLIPLTFWVIINIMLIYGVIGEIYNIVSVFLAVVVFIQVISISGPDDVL